MEKIRFCDSHDSQYDEDEGCEYCYKEYLDKQKLISEFLENLDRINKIVVGGCPKVNIITEIFGMKKEWEGRKDE